MTEKTIDNMTNCKIIAINEHNFSSRKITKHLNTTHATIKKLPEEKVPTSKFSKKVFKIS